MDRYSYTDNHFSSFRHTQSDLNQPSQILYSPRRERERVGEGDRDRKIERENERERDEALLPHVYPPVQLY